MTYVNDNTEPDQSEERNETVYHSGSVSANQMLEVMVEGLTASAVYTVTVWAENVAVNKSSEPVVMFADFTVTGKKDTVYHDWLWQFGLSACCHE